MNRRFLAATQTTATLALAGGLGLLAMPSATSGAPLGPMVSPAVDTEDVIYLRDGRELRGEIVSEDQFQVRFKVVDRKLDLATEITLLRDQIYKIERDVEVVETVAETGGSTTSSANTPSIDADVDFSLPGIYVVPIKGQMGTDVHYEVYEKIIEDIVARQPDCVVFKMNCNLDEDGPDFLEFEDYRILVHNFRQNLRKSNGEPIRQVMWIEDAVGVSSVIAMAWPDLYMMPEAQLDGLSLVNDVTAGWQDDDIRAKMQAAWSGICKGFMEYGGHSLTLGQAMMFPAESLSATFKGREVVWSLDETGEYVVDTLDDRTAGFGAEDARNLLISHETVEEVGEDDLDDLAFILGYREYRTCNGIGEETVEDYITDWRKAFDTTEKLLDEYQLVRALAQGEDTVKFLGQSQKILLQVLGAMNKYRAVEKTWERRGVTKLVIELMLEEIKEIIRGIRAQDRGRRGGGGGGNGPPPPGGGGGG